MSFDYPWTNGELKRLSRHIRDGTPAREDHPPYGDVMLWFNDLAAQIQKDIGSLNWPPLLRDRPFEVTSRPKTIDTLRDKLRRDRATPLPSVQDIAGVRFEAEMSLDEQDAVVTAICGLYGHDLQRSVRDLRESPHSGYRAVHVWLRLPARVEVQVRTHLQGEWANTYESAADVYGRSIRYDQLPADPVERQVVKWLRQMSTMRIAQMEKDRNEIGRISIDVENSERRGITTVPDSLKARLETLRRRFESNESQLRQEMSQLRSVFEKMREKG